MSAEVVPMPTPVDRHRLELRANLTDAGLGNRLAAMLEGQAVFIAPWRSWLVWDGATWRPDDYGRVQEIAKEIAPDLLLEAAAAARDGDDEGRKLLIRAGESAGGAYRIAAMQKMASTVPGLIMQPGDLDRDPFLLGCQNGTLDLRTGLLRQPERRDFITKRAPTSFDPTARDEIFDRYLDHLTGDDSEFRAYLQRAVGLSLTGATTEEVFFLVLGVAATGKSTLLEAMLATVGDYGRKCSFTTFIEQPNAGAIRPDLVALRGVRFATAVEASGRHQLNAPLVKELVGGDTITARGPYELETSFKPELKLWLGCNDAPRMSDVDTGLWRRLRRLPFERVVSNPDPAVKSHLCSAAGRKALLSWAVRGCLTWQQERLGSCAIVRAKSAELRSAMNPCEEFFATTTTLGPDLAVEAGELRRAYEHWCTASATRPVGARDWSARLLAMGCERRQGPRPGRAWRWCGIGLLSDRIES